MDTSTGERIRTRRLEMGMSQASLATMLSTTTTTVSNWERDVHMPEGDHPRMLAEVLQASPEDLGLPEPHELAVPVPPPWFRVWVVDWSERFSDWDARLGLIQKQLLRIESLLTQEVSASAQAEGQHQ